MPCSCVRSLWCVVAAFIGLWPALPAAAQSFSVEQRPSDLQWFVRSEDQGTVRNSRCADDVLFPFGSGGVYEVFSVRTTMVTNVPAGLFTARIDVYNGDANGPFGTPLHSLTTTITAAGDSVSFEGRTLGIYDVSTNGAGTLFSVPPGQRRWFVPVISATFAANERAYACSFNFNGTASGSVAAFYNAPATSSFTPATALNASFRDMSFRMESTQRPTNDSCGGALSIFTGSVAFDTRFASTGSIPLDNPCGGAGQFTNDIWYALTLPCSATVTLSTCNPQTTFDTMLAVYGICTTGSNQGLVACADNGPGGACPTNRAQLTFTPQPNTSYVIRVGGRSSSGTGVLTVSAPVQVPDECATLPAPVGPGLHTYCSLFATNSAADPVCGLFRSDFFIPFTTTRAGLHRITTCESGAFGDTKIGLYTSCVAASAVACSDTSFVCASLGFSQNHGEICFQSGAGQTWVARLGNGPGSPLGGVVRFRLAEPGDHNADGAFTVQDIYDFLSVWNESGPCSDFNGLNGVTVQDVYDFLFVWNNRVIP